MVKTKINDKIYKNTKQSKLLIPKNYSPANPVSKNKNISKQNAF